MGLEGWSVVSGFDGSGVSELRPIVVAHWKGCGAAAVKESIPLRSRRCSRCFLKGPGWTGKQHLCKRDLDSTCKRLTLSQQLSYGLMGIFHGDLIGISWNWWTTILHAWAVVLYWHWASSQGGIEQKEHRNCQSIQAITNTCIYYGPVLKLIAALWGQHFKPWLHVRPFSMWLSRGRAAKASWRFGLSKYLGLMYLLIHCWKSFRKTQDETLCGQRNHDNMKMLISMCAALNLHECWCSYLWNRTVKKWKTTFLFLGAQMGPKCKC